MRSTDIAFISELEAILRDRLQDPQENSYTATLAAAGVQRIAQKVGEEGVELALAAVSGDREQVIDEAADVVYHLLLLLAKRDLSLSDVATRLQSRHDARARRSG